jgi:mannose-6-phosphate isomerase
MSIAFPKTGSKQEIFDTVQRYLDDLKFTVVAKDAERPWGGFFVINESQALEFTRQFFPGVESETDEEGALQNLKVGEIIRLRQGQRHRLVGLGGWGMIAEIWQHTDINHPSDEDDIVRVQDDFGRSVL